MQRLYSGRGLSLHVFFFTSETDIWVQIGRGKVGLSGNIQVKSYIFQNENLTTFLILGEILSMYTKYEENPFAGFFNTTIVGKIFRNF